jgi:hypothetical protein
MKGEAVMYRRNAMQMNKNMKNSMCRMQCAMTDLLKNDNGFLLCMDCG